VREKKSAELKGLPGGTESFYGSFFTAVANEAPGNKNIKKKKKKKKKRKGEGGGDTHVRKDDDDTTSDRVLRRLAVFSKHAGSELLKV